MTWPCQANVYSSSGIHPDEKHKEGEKHSRLVNSIFTSLLCCPLKAAQVQRRGIIGRLRKAH
jgi:hypothetical protein